MNRNIIVGKLLAYIGIPVVLSAVILRFALFFFKSDGLSGMSLMYPLLVIGILMFALLMSFFSQHGFIRTAKNEMTTVFSGQLLYWLQHHLLVCCSIFYGAPR